MAVSKTRAKLVDVARQLFAKNGVDNTTMNDIAVASTKGRRTLYTYFKSKEDIYIAVVESELDKLSEALDKVASENIAPDVNGSTISNCRIGGSVKTATKALGTAAGEKTDDLSGSYDFTMFDKVDKAYMEDGSVNNLVCGQGYETVADDVTVTGFVYWDGK